MNKLIFNRSIALELSRSGYPIVEIIKNKKNINKDIYVFEETESFKNAFDKLLQERESKKTKNYANRGDAHAKTASNNNT